MASPPPLRHPVPTHPAYIPEPPTTPVSPQGYQRFTSSPQPPQDHQQQQHNPYNPQHVPAYNVYSQGSPPQQHQQHAPPPQNQGFNPTSFIPANLASAWGMNDATAQFGFQLGSSAVAAGSDYVQQNLNISGNLAGVKKSFDVSNEYVLSKLLILLFPWRHKSWGRKFLHRESGNGAAQDGKVSTGSPANTQVEWQSPRDDVNYPDLYIPSMAVVTYILVSAFRLGLQDKFRPSILGESATRAILVIFLDFSVIALGCYFLDVPSPVGNSRFFDLIAYCGYKFVGIILLLLLSLLSSNRTILWAFYLYFLVANAFFLLRSLRSLILPDTSHPTTAASYAGSGSGQVNYSIHTPSPHSTHHQKRRRVAFLFFEAVACQIVWMGVLVWV